MTVAMSATRTFELEPLGRFSLAEANAFGFGARMASEGARMQLAFASDVDWLPVAVELNQETDDGIISGVLHGDAPLDAAMRQVRRVLSLDHDGREWARVLEREAPLKALADQVPGMRPVLFHSPYEAAAWSIISARVARPQAAKLRHQIAMELGTPFTFESGETMAAFPSPGALLEGIDRVPLSEMKRGRLAGVAEAALDGQLDLELIHGMGPETATVHLQTIKGIGPFWATLIVVRASGFADALAQEPRARARALAAYGLPETSTEAEFAELAERWRPFRAWATVLCRVAHERGLR
ncbi:MAG: hypothetical protein J7513_13375 [Solirubrobacteraceae bacterium]|nr:hypothetical protein [Solirubrobacteraceae bacterium]